MQLFVELKELDSRIASEYTERKYEIIHDLAEAHFYDAKSYLLSGLDHPDPDYRWACINALAILWSVSDTDFIAKLMKLAQHDADVQVRAIAIRSLGFLGVIQSKPLLQSISESVKDSYVVNAARDALSELETRES